MTLAPVHIQIVYGSKDVDFVAKFLLPSLKVATDSPITVWCLNYHDETNRFAVADDMDIRWIDRQGNGPTGFGANHNQLFRSRGTKDDFFIVNSDCVLLPGSIDRLLNMMTSRPSAGIVEGRQWPFEHPKEYDLQTLETPWASGAFAYIRGTFFETSGGFDESFFMYLEDVDLSWRAWKSGYEVLYNPEAVAIHFSGGPFYRRDIRSAEEYFGSRNFLLLLKKHFGQDGERMGIEFLRQAFSPSVVEGIVADHYAKATAISEKSRDFNPHPKIKVIGFNQFHELRT